MKILTMYGFVLFIPLQKRSFTIYDASFSPSSSINKEIKRKCGNDSWLYVNVEYEYKKIVH